MFLNLITCLLDAVLIVWWEILSWSLKELKRLRVGVGMNEICNLMSPSSFEKQVPEVELDKLHVRDNVKLAEVNIKMFLYQDNIPMFEIWLCLSSNVKAKKMSLFFHKCATKQKQQRKESLWQSKLMFCYCVTDFFAVCSAIYYSGFMWHFHTFEIFLFGIAV